jgi:GntR family transcriptional regulator, transcriptional repressor for pyruvate dehydrogenase complex
MSSRPSVFRTIGNKEKLVDRVVNEIESLILEGQLPVGSKLPPEREFALQLGVSRTVIREAVRILMARGLLDTKPGVGTTICQVTGEHVLKPLSLFLQTRSGGISIDQLHQVRSILEVANAGLAAEQATDAEVEELKKLLEEMAAFQQDPAQFAARDAEFHKRIAETTHNPLLIVLIDSLGDLMAEVRAMVAGQPALPRKAMTGHRKVLDRIAGKDPAGAREAMLQHLNTARKIQEEFVSKQKRDKRT